MTSPTRESAARELHLLGGVALSGIPSDGADQLIKQSKVVGLLACLALSPTGGFTRRDRLVGLLWPELDQSHARTALRKAVHYSRSILGEEAIVGRGDEELALSTQSLKCDAVELRLAVEKGHLARAVELYRGELLPGFFLPECHDFDAWLEEQRSSLRESAVAACWALAQHLEAGDNGTEASKYARRLTRLDRTNERLLRRAMQMLDRLGDRAGALNVYEEFTRRLRKELEADPSPETVKLAESIRSGATSRGA
jgi:serine/threonine-protein kinase